MVPKIRTVSACCPGFTTSTNGSTCVPLCRSGWSDLLLSVIFWSDLADSLKKDFYKMVSDWEHLKEIRDCDGGEMVALGFQNSSEWEILLSPISKVFHIMEI